MMITPSSTTYMVCIGGSVVLTKDKQFFEGLQFGYSNFLSLHERRLLQEQDIYKTCMSIVDVKRSGVYQTGVVTGWITAMLSSSIECQLIEIPQDNSSEP